MKSVFSPVQAFGSGWLDASSVLDSWFRSYRSLEAFVHRRRRVELLLKMMLVIPDCALDLSRADIGLPRSDFTLLLLFISLSTPASLKLLQISLSPGESVHPRLNKGQ